MRFSSSWICLPLASLALTLPAAATAAMVRPEAVKAHEDFLAGDALQGRGSATPDETKAAAYVAAQFRSFGLRPPPGSSSFLQAVTIIAPELKQPPVLSVGGEALPGFTLLSATPNAVRGKLQWVATDDAGTIPAGDVIAVASDRIPFREILRAARGRHAKLLIVRQSADSDRYREQSGGETRMRPYLEGEAPEGMAIAALPAAAFDRLAAEAGREARLDLPGLERVRLTTTNAVGWLPGSDPDAGVLLLSAHLDHLGRMPDGTIMHGADDDASGTTAVLELARALAAGPRSRRSILFVCYGSEEIGGYGSAYFARHPPVPLARIAANIEFEMIGAQDPKLPKGTLMMTGFDRSNLGEALAAHGALVTRDPYPDEHFFERSDNYQLALKGVVAHTVSGWAVTPVYHQPTDTVDQLDIPFMTRAIQSLIEPVRWLASSDFQPEWKGEGRPREE